MWPYHPDLLDQPVPRYTSYPTAAEFRSDVGAGHYLEALRTIERGTAVSLYVHIPYCTEICWYCGCNTARAGPAQRLAGYLDALMREVALVAAAIDKPVTVRRIAFGGGSPNAVGPLDFVRLLDAIYTAFRIDHVPLSIEIDPRGFSEVWAGTLASCGARQASLGVQTFDPEVQRRIGRVQPSATIVRAVALLRRAGLESINFDLMYGLPGQTMASLDASLAEAVLLQPDRIALFGYAHVPHLVKRQQRIDATTLPDAALRFAMACRGAVLLQDAGYVAVGFDHFARPCDPLARAAIGGTLARNFQGFTDDDAEVLIGFGASAISQFPQLIVQAEKNLGRYGMLVSGGHLAAVHGVVRDADDQQRAKVIADILCGRPADIGMVRRHGIDEQRLRAFIDRGLVAIHGDRLVAASGARPYLRAVAACFDAYRSAPGARFSSAI